MGFKVTDNDRELYLKCTTPEEKQAFILNKWYTNDFKSLSFELRDSNNRSMVISDLEARRLLDEEKYYELVGEYITNNGGSIEVPKTLGEYSVAIVGDGLPNEREPLYANTADIVNYKKTPHIFAKNIIYDLEHDDIVNLIVSNGLVEKAVGKTEEQIINEARKDEDPRSDEDIIFNTVSRGRWLRGYLEEVEEEAIDMANLADTMLIPEYVILETYNGERDYIEGISDYITNESSFCHKGFDIVCNLNAEEIESLIAKTSIDLLNISVKNTPFSEYITHELENNIKYYEAALEIVKESSRRIEEEEESDIDR